MKSLCGNIYYKNASFFLIVEEYPGYVTSYVISDRSEGEYRPIGMFISKPSNWELINQLDDDDHNLTYGSWFVIPWRKFHFKKEMILSEELEFVGRIKSDILSSIIKNVPSAIEAAKTITNERGVPILDDNGDDSIAYVLWRNSEINKGIISD